MSGSERLRAALATKDRDTLVAILAPNVVWSGHAALGNGGLQCTSREQVADVFDAYIAAGHAGGPEIVAEVADEVVVDPHPEPPVPGFETIHHVYKLSDGLVIRMQDYPDRASALAAVGMEP
jgi:ketosteroid isomerase-like protein